MLKFYLLSNSIFKKICKTSKLHILQVSKALKFIKYFKFIANQGKILIKNRKNNFVSKFLKHILIFKV